MSAILIDEDIIHYEVLGRGRPVLFLHGWIGSWRYWIPAMQMASTTFRAYALDLYGFGDTVKNQRRYSLEAQSGLISDFMEKMGIGRIAIVGHGLGALAGLLFALRNPGIVDRLMAVSFPLEEALISNRLRHAQPAELAESLLGKSALTEPVLTDASKTDPQAVTGSLDGLARYYSAGLWFQLNTACLLVFGSNDPLVQTPRVETQVRFSPLVHSIVFDGGGHFPMLADSSKFCRLLCDFLALAPGESPQQLQLKEEWKRRVR